ncbi:Dihydrolipoyllysine-residue acetyltransferase component of pyruvate dehydrogenase complex [Arthrobacter ulcerisalmonis]|uniref:Dihydrolipoamide acetyltransferase component of pyruvate dehydrogenase complex n=1 Tax=Arthrobacter ulcerisalmonis TaxID=2483813 RepID=A0A3P5X2G1_9MICC|nr:dihydrolipoamide acetyltransferase family protein [Arthrobacter ulcerisalmonis]VDC24736.1 Dihydrolipoyllysine-residue acetyltransferase component of pyruvate dehydrogenase complex [Arthrobacter ulcerisalmonis]
MSESQVFLLPDLGEGLTEAELVSWLVSVGDQIVVDQPIAEVETAKSTVEVPSPFAGIVAQLHGQPGETLDVGRPLISVTPLGAAVESAGLATEAAPAAAQTYREEERAGSGNVLIGYGTPGGADVPRRSRPARQQTNDAGTHPAAAVAEPVAAAAAKTADDLLLLRTRVPGKLGAVISPLVRRMAREHGVDLGAVSGSGDSGLIMRRDVEAAIGTPPSPHGSAAASDEASPSAATRAVASDPIAKDDTEIDRRTGLGIASREPVRGVRKVVAATMARSRTEIPEATVWVDVDATALVDLKGGGADAPSLLAFISRFVTAGLRKYPALNTRLEAAPDGGQQIVTFDGVNLGFAAQTDRGLVVPSIVAAHKLSARELDGEIRRLTAVARAGKATPAELGRGTFTVNNYGVFGVDGSAAIINHPEVAILGIGRIIDKPWVVRGELAVRKVVELTLTFDHRVCDGGTAAGFLRYVADAVESPGTVLADL